jgi:hypothetical protein
MLPLKYLAGYPEDLQSQVREAIRQGHLGHDVAPEVSRNTRGTY